ncbi:MAG: integrase core domain-containing protein [Nitrosospira sp.]
MEDRRQNGFAESFNGRFRDARLNEHGFVSIPLRILEMS